MLRCWFCGIEITGEEAFQYSVKTGYSQKDFPLVGYEEVSLCYYCLKRHQRKDKHLKYAAAVVLVLVLAFIVRGLFLLFTSF